MGAGECGCTVRYCKRGKIRSARKWRYDLGLEHWKDSQFYHILTLRDKTALNVDPNDLAECYMRHFCHFYSNTDVSTNTTTTVPCTCEVE